MVKSTDPVPENAYNDFANKVLGVDTDGNPYTKTNPIPVTGVTSNHTDLEGNGPITIGTTLVELTFSGTTEAITIQANYLNTGIIYWGKSDVLSDGSNAMGLLEAGISVAIDYDDSTNAIYVVSDTADQIVIAGAAK